MESFIVLLVFVVFLALIVSLGYEHDEEKPKSSKATKPTRSISIGGKVVEPFDGSRQSKVTSSTIITGPAFIIDGDSIVIKKTQIRLFGIDAPELNHPYGKKAKWALVKLCKGHEVRAEVVARDDHGRTVAKCTLPDGQDLSAEMIKLGLAIDWPKFSGGKYSHMEVAGVRQKLWLADARQKGRMHVWEKFEKNQKENAVNEIF